MTSDSPRTECKRCSHGAVWCSRRLYRPSKEPRADGMTARAPVAAWPEGARLRSPHGPKEPRPTRGHGRRYHRAPMLEGPRSTKRTPTCGKPSGCAKETEVFRPNARTRPNPRMNPGSWKKPVNKMIFVCRYNVQSSAAAAHDGIGGRRLQTVVGRLPIC